FQYAHVPETLLMLGLWAAHRWAWAFVVLLWLVAAAGVWGVMQADPAAESRARALSKRTVERDLPKHPIYGTEDPFVLHVPKHPLFAADRLALWPRCWAPDRSPADRYERWDRLCLYPAHEAVIGWRELAEVEEFLRSRGAADGEVLAWFDSPHALYLMTSLKPPAGWRFMHVFTAISIFPDKNGENGQVKVMRELQRLPPPPAGRVMYVVSDLEWAAVNATSPDDRKRLLAPAPAAGGLLPPDFPCAADFPFNQPAVFRSRGGHGRYLVHELVTRDSGPLPDR
ncbi:MAG: hypothetical protein K2V38_19070, partial [Gemmataceae bacterium]|nr:hypothetical protein [Gemmataceae bacterium]